MFIPIAEGAIDDGLLLIHLAVPLAVTGLIASYAGSPCSGSQVRRAASVHRCLTLTGEWRGTEAGSMLVRGGALEEDAMIMT